MMSIPFVVALAIVCHAWIGRIQGPPQLVNAVAWIVAVLTLLVLAMGLLRL